MELGFPADSREYGIGSQILVDLGVTTMRLMTNNPAKYGGLEGYGLEIVERVPLHVVPNDENIAYLRTKQEKLGLTSSTIEAERGAECAGKTDAYRENRMHARGAVTYADDRRARSTPRGDADRDRRGAASTTTSPTPLLDGALATPAHATGSTDVRTVHWVPGAFEIPLVAQHLAALGRSATP